MEEIREVPHFENGVEHKILITYVIAKVSSGNKTSEAETKTVVCTTTPRCETAATPLPRGKAV